MARRKAAKWMDRPSGPGRWLCHGTTLRDCVVELDQEDIDNGAPFASSRVYGPIPPDDRLRKSGSVKVVSAGKAKGIT